MVLVSDCILVDKGVKKMTLLGGTTEIHRVTQTRTDLDRPGQTRTDLIKRTFGTLFGTLKDLWDQCRSFLDTKLDPFIWDL